MRAKKVKNKNVIRPLKGSNLWGVLIFAVLLLIDMVTKVAAEEYFSNPNHPKLIEVIPDWISLCLAYNDGIAYGIGSNSPSWLKLTVVAGTGVMMLVFAIVYFKLDKSRAWARTALVFIVAGGVGNLIDRIYFRVWEPSVVYGVRDMVDLSRFGFAVCNFADFFITGGAVVLVLALLFFDKDALFPVGKYKLQAKQIAELAKEEEEETAVEIQVEKKNG